MNLFEELGLRYLAWVYRHGLAEPRVRTLQRLLEMVGLTVEGVRIVKRDGG